MKTRVVLPGLALAACLLTGCGGGEGLPYAREMADMALLRTVGVDAGEPHGVAVTVSTGQRAKGLQGEMQPPLILSGGRDTLAAACQDIQGLSDNYVFYGYVDQLLLGEELAGEGVIPTLDYFARDVELGLGVQLWLVKGAQAAQAIQAGKETGVDSRLATLQTDGEMGAGGMTVTAGETYSRLLEGNSAYVPALAPAQQGGSTLLEAGYGVLRDGRLAGWLEGDAARGLELLAGHPPAQLWECDLPAGRCAARWTRSDLSCRLILDQQGQPTGLAVKLRLSARIEESPGALKGEQRKQVEQSLERAARRCAQTALEQLQSWSADCLALGRRCGLRRWWDWQSLEQSWTGAFPLLDIQVDAQVTLTNEG